MMEIKQIEVNGTTYDIAIPGSDYPLQVAFGGVQECQLVLYSDATHAADGSGNGLFAEYPIQEATFVWKQTGSAGEYKYQLVLLVDSFPEDERYGGVSVVEK